MNTMQLILQPLSDDDGTNLGMLYNMYLEFFVSGICFFMVFQI